MAQIKAEDITVRPRWQFGLIRVAKIAAISILALVIIMSVAAITYTLKTDMFKDYLAMGKTGVIDFAKAIPWAALLAIGLASATMIWLSKKNLLKQNLSWAAVVGSLLIITVIGVGFGLKSSGSANSLPSKLANSYRGGSQPQKLLGTVVGFDGETIVVKGNDGVEYKARYKNGTQFINGNPEIGDKVLILGFEKYGIVTVEAIKLEQRSEATKSENPTLPLQPEDKPLVEETQVTKETTTTQPKPATTTTPTAEPTPVPAPFVKTITITSISSMYSNPPNYKYQISWSTNFSSPLGYKLVWAVAPGIPTYPLGANQNYYYDSASNGWGFVRNNLSPASGVYNVRVCEYLGGTCSSVYSTTVQVSFP